MQTNDEYQLAGGTYVTDKEGNFVFFFWFCFVFNEVVAAMQVFLWKSRES